MTLPLVTADERARLLAHGAALAAGQRLNPLPVRRDRYFQAVRPLSEYVRLAQENGAITD